MNCVFTSRTKPFPPRLEPVDLHRQGAVVSPSNLTAHLICEGQTDETSPDGNNNTMIVMGKTSRGGLERKAGGRYLAAPSQPSFRAILLSAESLPLAKKRVRVSTKQQLIQ